MGDQALVQLASEQGDAVGTRVVPEEMAAHAEWQNSSGVGASARSALPGTTRNTLTVKGGPGVMLPSLSVNSRSKAPSARECRTPMGCHRDGANH